MTVGGRSNNEQMMRVRYYRQLGIWLDMLERGEATHAEVNEWWREMDREYEEKELLT